MISLKPLHGKCIKQHDDQFKTTPWEMYLFEPWDTSETGAGKGYFHCSDSAIGTNQTQLLYDFP